MSPKISESESGVGVMTYVLRSNSGVGSSFALHCTAFVFADRSYTQMINNKIYCNLCTVSSLFNVGLGYVLTRQDFLNLQLSNIVSSAMYLSRLISYAVLSLLLSLLNIPTCFSGMTVDTNGSHAMLLRQGRGIPEILSSKTLVDSVY